MKSDRFEAIKAVGCICTLLIHRQGQGCDIHHLTRSGRRRGDQYTIGLSPWNHRGVKVDGLSRQQMMVLYGPSLAHSREAFELAFGSQDLLLKIQNLVLEDYAKHNWVDFDPPYEVRRRAILLWTEKRKQYPGYGSYAARHPS